jgi:hypothetical protein
VRKGGADEALASTTTPAAPAPLKGELPEYSALVANPGCRVPDELANAEKSTLFTTRVQEIQHELLAPPRRPADDRPLLTFFVSSTQRGVIHFGLPTGERCLPVFTSSLRAADYRRLMLSNAPPNQYIASNASQFLVALRVIERAGIERFAVDRCPRCTVLAVVATKSMQTPNDVITIWSINTAIKWSREALYFQYALREARAGRLEVARDVALSSVGHVSLEEARVHLLLGEVAVGLKDRILLGEAKAFLVLLRQEPLLRVLEQAEKRGTPDFGVALAPA